MSHQIGVPTVIVELTCMTSSSDPTDLVYYAKVSVAIRDYYIICMSSLTLCISFDFIESQIQVSESN